VENEKYATFPKWNGSLATYYRIDIANILDLDKVLYLDCDVIIHADISHIFEYNIDTYAIGAANDIE
jgi:lipopolysaccharide biosynthesis glycosyltransferase